MGSEAKILKVVINKCYGGFGLSNEAIEWLINNKGWKVADADMNDNVADDNEKKENRAPIIKWHENSTFYKIGDKYSIIRVKYDDDFRFNPDIIEVVETLGNKADGRHASLKIVEIPDNIKWEIEEYDGIEWIAEKHRTWG